MLKLMLEQEVRVVRNVLFLLYCVYLYFAYHLLVIPAFAEYSFYALLIVPFMLLVFWLLPAGERKKLVVLTLLFLFIDQAIFNIMAKIGPMRYLWIAFIALFLFPIVKFYAKVRWPAFVIALAVAVGFNFALPDRLVIALSHLYPKWTSEKLYIGSVTDSFAVAAGDIDGDGSAELITFGNKDFYPDGLRPPKYGFMLDDERLHLIVYTWRDGQMVRVDAADIGVGKRYDWESIRALLPYDLIHFPYYAFNEASHNEASHMGDASVPNFVLEPLVQRQWLTESMMRTGAAPFQALRLNLTHIERLFAANGYIYDQLASSGSYRNILLKQGVLSGVYIDAENLDDLDDLDDLDESKGAEMAVVTAKPFAVDSTATKIIGSITMIGADGQQTEGLLVMGRDLHLWQMVGDSFEKTHMLTREMHNSLTLSRLFVEDLTGDGSDELIVTYPFTKIVKPRADGTWDIIWATDEKGFNIKTVGSFLPEGETEIIALRKSAVRASDVSYLTSFRYDDHALRQNWKVFMRGIDTALFADVDGDGSNELVTTLIGKQKLYVWSKHRLPVIPILLAITALLVLWLAVRNLTERRRGKGGTEREDERGYSDREHKVGDAEERPHFTKFNSERRGTDGTEQ